MSYEQLQEHAGDIYDKAVKKYLEHHYGIVESGGYYYSPQDSESMSGMSTARYTDDEMKQYVKEAENEFADVPGLFSDFLALPRSSDFTGSIDAVKSAMRKLSTAATGGGVSDPVTGDLYPANVELDNMTNAAPYLADWDGVAMQDFRENFLTPFPDRCGNQFMACVVLLHALDAEGDLWDATRKDIDKIAEDTLHALDHMDDCGKNQWAMGFEVLGAVIAVGALTVASGGTAAIALGVAAGATAVGAKYVDQQPDASPSKYDGESAEAVIGSCRQAINDLKAHILEKEDLVKTACTNANATLTGQASDFVAPKPKLLDATGTPHQVLGE